VYRKAGSGQSKDAIDILNERYARGEMIKEDYFQMKSNLKK
jgi:uncharacterized membrane protein